MASIVDLEKLAAILREWPDHEPSRYEPEAYHLFWALPQALGSGLLYQERDRVELMKVTRSSFSLCRRAVGGKFP